MFLPSETFTKEEKSSAIATLRKNRAEKKAWEEDNRQRKQDEKPTRTMREYKAALNPPPLPPPNPQNQLKGKPKMSDPREPQSDRLPNMKIPLAKTDGQYRGIRHHREQMAMFRRPDHSKPPKTATVAGIKRRAEEQSGHTDKKPKTTAGAATAVKRKADEQNSGPAKRLKIGSFIDYLPKADNQFEADNGLKACKRSPSTGAKNKADGQSAGASEGSKVEIAALSTKQTNDKNTVTNATAKPKQAPKSQTPGTKRKAEEQQGVAKGSGLNSASSQATVDKKATSGGTSTVGPQKESFRGNSVTADRAKSAERCENGTESDPLVKPVQTQSLAASCEQDRSKTTTGDTFANLDLQPKRPYAEFNKTQVKEDLEATEISDKAKSQIEPAPTGSTTLRTEHKRKRDEEIESPVKKSKLLSGNPENSLRNYRQACFINASLHILHSVPAFASMRNDNSDMTVADNILDETEMKIAGAGGRTRAKEDAREKLRYHLRMKAGRNELKLSPHLNQMMMLLSADEESPHEINPFVFQQICGTMFTGNEDNPMNGETQEDAYEFIVKLLSQMRKENPGLDLDQLLGAQFAEQQVCECGSAKTFTEESCNFNIPEDFQSDRYRVDLGALLTRYLRDKSRFAHYRCEKCGESGKWFAKDGWDGKLMTKSPEYLVANVPRGRIQSTGHRTEEVKLTTKIRPPLKKVSIPSVDSSRVHYHMVAMIKHDGKNLHRGHYTAVRKIRNQWWHCNDTGRGGVTLLSRADIRLHEDGCIFLLKKTSDSDVDETT